MSTRIDERFFAQKPLVLCAKNYPKKFLLKYRDIGPSKKYDLNIFEKGQILERPKDEIVFGLNVKNEHFTQYDVLTIYEGQRLLIVNKRILPIFQEMCPNDYQAFPIAIQNTRPLENGFNNKDFYILNITNRIEHMDFSKSFFEGNPDFPNMKKAVFLENCMQDHLLSRSFCTLSILFHPKLALALKKAKGIQFLTDKDLSRYQGERRGPLHEYLSWNYQELIEKYNVQDEFCQYGESAAGMIAERFKDEIYVNRCKECGSLKKTPKAKLCLNCGVTSE